MVLGSPKYMSPEQVMGKLIDQRSDVFSLGVVLYEMLTGKAPFVGENVNAIMYQTLNTIPSPPGTLNPTVPDMLNFIVAKALAKGVDDRYQSAKELADDLRACRDGLLRLLPPVTAGKSSLSLADETAIVPRVENSDELAQAPTLGLSTAFDSFGATMRLAALTASSEEVESLSRTFKMPRPTAEELNLAAPPVQSVAPVKFASATLSASNQDKPSTVENLSPDKKGAILIAITVFISLILIFAILH
jgi:serine/threonine-protein kinase